MPFIQVQWTDEIIEHLAEHDVSPDDFEFLINAPTSKGWSRSSGLPAVWGYTPDGRYLMLIYDEIDVVTVLPVTAYEVPEP